MSFLQVDFMPPGYSRTHVNARTHAIWVRMNGRVTEVRHNEGLCYRLACEM